MKKTVLFLMNGFGVEQADSHNVYNSKLMPNLDSYTQKYMFSSIQNFSYDFMDGYRLFSTGSKNPLTFDLLKKYQDNFEKNSNMNFYLNNINEGSKIQLFIFLENESSLYHLKSFLKFIRTKHSNPIFLHIVFTSRDINNYKNLQSIMNKINYDYKDCKIATVIGENIVKGSEHTSYMDLLQNEVGEKWRELSRKFSSLIESKTSPFNVREFFMNEGFKITDGDIYFFFNYEYTDLTNLITNINKIMPNSKFFSMFPIKGVKYPLFAYPSSAKSIAESLSKIGCNALILADKPYINQINYIANGFKNVVSKNLFYVPIVPQILLDKSKLEIVLKDSKYELTIIDFRVDNVNTLNELNNKLANLDTILGYVHDICVENKISLFISSLYGMKRNIYVDNFTNAFIDFSGKLPLIVIDDVFTKTNFRLDYGDSFNLANTLYTNMNRKYNDGEVLIKKKGFLTKLLKK